MNRIGIKSFFMRIKRFLFHPFSIFSMVILIGVTFILSVVDWYTPDINTLRYLYSSIFQGLSALIGILLVALTLGYQRSREILRILWVNISESFRGLLDENAEDLKQVESRINTWRMKDFEDKKSRLSGIVQSIRAKRQAKEAEEMRRINEQVRLKEESEKRKATASTQSSIYDQQLANIAESLVPTITAALQNQESLKYLTEPFHIPPIYSLEPALPTDEEECRRLCTEIERDDEDYRKIIRDIQLQHEERKRMDRMTVGTLLSMLPLMIVLVISIFLLGFVDNISNDSKMFSILPIVAMYLTGVSIISSFIFMYRMFSSISEKEGTLTVKKARDRDLQSLIDDGRKLSGENSPSN